MDPERQREIATQGGKAVQSLGIGHKFDTEKARAAGSAGGKAHSRKHMAQIGRLGGFATAAKRKAQ